MRSWLLLCLTSAALACSGGGDEPVSLLYALCVRACAHIHEQNCADAPTAKVEECLEECQQTSLPAGSACTDEQASLFACTETATITCGGSLGTAYEVKGCENEQLAVNSCINPLGACVRSPGSDSICLMVGPPNFYQCSDGSQPMTGGPPCFQVSANGFCCPL